MNNSIKPQNFQADVKALLKHAEKKGLYIHGVVTNLKKVVTLSPTDNVDSLAKFMALTICTFSNSQNFNLDSFIDKILAHIAILRKDD